MNMIKYVNSAGAEIVLNDITNYCVHENSLREWEWDYAVAGRTDGFGSKVTRFARQYAVRYLQIGISGANFNALLNALHALTEYDVLAKNPGQLYVGSQYIRCYIVSSETNQYNICAPYIEKEMKILIVEPFWVTEVTQSFSPDPATLTAGKRYPLRFPYRYGTGYSNYMLYNSHYANSKMKIVFYGPCANPSIRINGKTYAITAVLLANERIEVDQRDHTIIKIDASGAQYNMFNNRNKENDIFLVAPSGTCLVAFSALVFDITLYQQRSEIKWL